MKLLKHILIIACVSALVAGCGDSQQETVTDSSGAPQELPDTLKLKRGKTTYVITGIGTRGTNKVAIINNQVVQPGMEIDTGVVLEDIQSTYAIIRVGNTKHLLRPEDMQRQLNEKKR